MASFPNTSRRMFRGRGGPTDGNINKHQARRRKQQPEVRPEKNNKYGDVDVPPMSIQAVMEEDLTQEESVAVIVVESLPPISQIAPPPSEAPTAIEKEIKHLLKRIRNVSESITLSSEAISNPITWRNDVLNAVTNTIVEWQAILSHHEHDVETTKEPALAIFMLIQQAMQSGPLTGSNPGYFKRCGAAVAKQALAFLNDIPADDHLHLFTEKQCLAIAKWRKDARKAVENDRPPSKSQLKKQAGKKKKKK